MDRDYIYFDNQSCTSILHFLLAACSNILCMTASKTLTSSALQCSTKIMCSLKFQVATQCAIKRQSIDSVLSKLFVDC